MPTPKQTSTSKWASMTRIPYIMGTKFKIYLQQRMRLRSMESRRIKPSASQHFPTCNLL